MQANFNYSEKQTVAENIQRHKATYTQYFLYKDKCINVVSSVICYFVLVEITESKLTFKNPLSHTHSPEISADQEDYNLVQIAERLALNK